MKNSSGANLAKIAWRVGENDFTEANSVHFPIVENDSVLREYQFPIGWESGWQGRISGFRISPAFSSETGSFIEVSTFGIYDYPELISIDYEKSSQGLYARAGVRSAENRGGSWSVVLSGEEDAILQIPDHEFAFVAHPEDVLEILVANATDVTSGEIRFYSHENGNSAKSSILEQSDEHIPFQIDPSNSNQQKIVIELGKSPLWQGHINHLAIVLHSSGAEPGSGFSVDQVSLVNTSIRGDVP
ncbi:MAG: hypothetical protein ACFCU1_02680 [Sumerlaeia bacterium]